MFGRTGSLVIGVAVLMSSLFALAEICVAKPLEPGKRSFLSKRVEALDNAEAVNLVAKSSEAGKSIGTEAASEASHEESARAERSREKLMSALSSGENALLLQGNRIADIVEATAPAVVNIEIEKPGPSSVVPGFPPGFLGGQMRFFFNGREISPQEMGRPMRLQHGTGSGFIIREDGHILTNVHVIKDARKITVTLHDGRAFNAKLVGVDSFSDLAVLKIDADHLPTIKMGESSKLRSGEFVVAIGSPLDYDHTVTFGIVSGLGRTVYDINENINFIQTDAAINEGNSGGPLLNLKGEAIGVNTAVVRQFVAQNIGFSIPIDVAKVVSEDLMARKKIQRPWLGLGMKPISDTLLKSLKLPIDTRGVLVDSTFENSPAERAGLKKDDIIEKIDGKLMGSPKEVRDCVRAHRVNDTLNFYVLRNGNGQEIAVDIGEYPSAVDAIPHPNEKRDNGMDDNSGNDTTHD